MNGILTHNVGGTILYRFVEENRRRKIKINSDNQMMMYGGINSKSVQAHCIDDKKETQKRNKQRANCH